MRFTREVFLATELMSIVPTGKPMSARKLAVKLGTTEFFLQRIIGKLRKADLVQVKKGPEGGVFACMKPTDITVLDVYQALGKHETDLEQGSFLDQVHTNVLNLLAAERIPYRGLETEGDRGGV